MVQLAPFHVFFSNFTRSGFPPFVWKVVVFKFPQTKLLFKTVVNAIIHAPAAHALFPPNTYLTSWEKAGRGRKIAHFLKASRFSYMYGRGEEVALQQSFWTISLSFRSHKREG